jgi:hypothetical protein
VYFHGSIVNIKIGEVFSLSLSHLAVLHSMDQVRWYELVPIKLSFFVFASFSLIQTCHIVQKIACSLSSTFQLDTSVDNKLYDWRFEVRFSEVVGLFSTATSSFAPIGAMIRA